MKKTIILLGLIFALGWLAGNVYSIEQLENPISFTTSELISPFDRIDSNQILIYEDYILIRIQGATLASYANTNSMDPILDSEANGIEIIPTSEEDIRVGDIITYEASWNEGLVVHRVIFIGEDEEGWYCVTKGDNSRFTDPGKTRFGEIKYLLIGVIY